MDEAGAKKQEWSPGPQLLQAVRAGFVLRGTTLHAWCKEQGVHRANATTALLGGWRGPKGKRLAERVVKAAGVGTVRWQ